MMSELSEDDKLSPFLRVFSPRPSNSGIPLLAAKKIFFPQSPCPSPTPVFQQLYMALANFDRLTQESPDATSTLFDFKSSPNKRSNSMSSVIAKAEESYEINLRRQSFPLSLTSNNSTQGRGTIFSVVNIIITRYYCQKKLLERKPMFC